MVGKVAADARQAEAGRDADGGQVIRVADARKLQHLRRPYRPRRQDDLARCPYFLCLAALKVAHADAPAVFDDQAGCRGIGDDLDIAPCRRDLEVGAEGRPSQPATARHLRVTDTFLARAIEVGRVGESRLLRRLHEQMRQRQDGTVVLDLERPGPAPVLGIAVAGIGLAAPEQRHHLVVAPAAATELRPAVIVGRVAANIEHAVDRARTAQHLAARRMDGPAIGAFLRLGGVHPVVAGIVKQVSDAGWDVNERMRVAAAGLEEADPVAGLGQPRGDDASRGTRTYHDEVWLHDAPSLPGLARTALTAMKNGKNHTPSGCMKY